MPTHRLTLAKNTNRATRTVLLLPSSHPTPQSLIQATARSKLRLRSKFPLIFLLPTGKDLTALPAPDFFSAIQRTPDATLLLSDGEPYIGSIVAPRELGAEVRSLANDADIDPLALTQLATTARLPGVLLALAQPDLHPGNKFPIGAVVVSKGVLHPPLIGSDIGCGMSYYRLSARASTYSEPRRVVGLLTGLEGTWKTPAHRAAWVGEGGKVGAFDTALGTIGAGNHFAELQEVELGVPGVVETGEAVLLVHSGSRGFGGYVLGRFYDRESKVESVREGRIDVEQQPGSALEYLALHDRACVWARANRDLIALRFLQVLEPGGGWECVDVKGVAGLRVRVQQRKFVDIHHNNVVKALWPPAADIQEEVYIHRKGAAPTTPDHPLLPLPGSRGTPTLLLRPLYTEENGFGERHAMSAAHGAGRAMSRAEAKNHLWRRYDEGNGREVVNGFTGSMGGKGGRDEGEGDFVASASAVKKKAGSKGTLGWVVCDQKELIWEEAPAAYKDVEAVGRDLVKAGVVAVVGRCRPLVTYKGKKE